MMLTIMLSERSQIPEYKLYDSHFYCNLDEVKLL